jgi:hypothetical protein
MQCGQLASEQQPLVDTISFSHRDAKRECIEPLGLRNDSVE